jgi:starch-binding outer membrane protein SusE/F
MKRIITAFTSLVLATFLLESCEKEENKIFYEGGTAPVLTSSTNTVSLKPPPADESVEALKLNWTNPNYTFTTGVSSQDVSYTLEMDTVGVNFGSPGKYTTSISKELTKSFTVLELNNILGNSMLLKPGRTYTIEARIKSSLAANAVSLTSNKVSFTATPYAPPPKVEPPTAGTLWATGDAFASNWANPLPAPYDVSQKFTKLSNTLYELVVTMPGGGNYKLIQEQGNWGTQYHMKSGSSAGGVFEKKDADPAFPGPSSAGTYKITFDFQLGNFTVVKQ